MKYLTLLFLALMLSFHADAKSKHFYSSYYEIHQFKSSLAKHEYSAKKITYYLKRRKLPKSFIIIPYIESNFNNYARSRKGARGMWQLMPFTARLMGIQVNRHRDDRINFARSTHAALKYIQNLYYYYHGNDILVVAAYNAGKGRVDSTLKKIHGYHSGRKETQFMFDLPRETRRYVGRYKVLKSYVDSRYFKI